MMTLTRNNFPFFIILLICAATLESCDDKEFINPGGNTISFITVPDTASITDNTRTTYDNRSSGGFTLLNEDATDTLFLFASVTDNIEPVYRETRAMPIDETNFDEFNVFAHLKTNGDLQPNFYMADKVTKKEAEWNTANTYYWPGAKFSLRFFAYAPLNASAVFPSNSSTTEIEYTVPSKVTEQQDLIIATTEEIQGNITDPVSLTFKHLCTAVKFSVGEIGGTIHSIKIKGVNNYGTFDMVDYARGWTNLSGSEEFSPLSTDTSLGDKPATNTPITEGEYTLMMLPQTLPTGAQIIVEHTPYGENSKSTLTADIGGTVWPIGKTVNYTISKTNIIMNFEVKIKKTAAGVYSDNAIIDHLGKDDLYLDVTSTKQTITDRRDEMDYNIPWQIVIIESSSDADGSIWKEESDHTAIINSWFDLGENTMPTSGVGNISERKVGVVEQWFVRKYDAAVQEFPDEDINTTSGNTPYNLANQTDGGEENENTANCYMISAPGTYSLPLVYGNAWKNGAKNPAAYTWQNTATHGQILETFKNYQDYDIEDPYITGAKSAVLLWQDEMNLIKTVKLDGNKLVFETGEKKDLQPGNAVVAIKDNDGRVMWSWHIWFSLNKLGTGKIADINLGWCEAMSHIEYPERHVRITFKQEGNEATKQITLKQTGHAESKKLFCNNTCYQWGRKDPFPGHLAVPSSVVGTMWDFVDGDDGLYLTKNKPIYDISNRMLMFWDGEKDIDQMEHAWDDKKKQRIVLNIYNTMRDKRTIGNAIQNPDVFYSPGKYVTKELDKYPTPIDAEGGGHYGWNANVYLNLWDTNLDIELTGDAITVNTVRADDKKPIKTIYDPCPVGYRVPSYEEFNHLQGHEEGVQAEYSETNFPHVVIYNVKDDASTAINFHIVGGRRVTCGQTVRFTHPKDSRGHYWLIEAAGEMEKIGGIYELEVYGGGMVTTDNKHMKPAILTCAYSDALSIRPVKENWAQQSQ